LLTALSFKRATYSRHEAEQHELSYESKYGTTDKHTHLQIQVYLKNN